LPLSLSISAIGQHPTDHGEDHAEIELANPPHRLAANVCGERVHVNLRRSELLGHARMALTHEEIAEIIGTTRETVSRLFSEFKKRQLLGLKGSTLLIRNRPALEKIIQS
jgi:CRP-like cAMP-binding protein